MLVNFLQWVSCSLTLPIFLLGASHFSFWFAKSLCIFGLSYLCMCMCVCTHKYVCICTFFYPALYHKILNLKKKRSLNYMLVSHSTWKRFIQFLLQYKVTNMLLQSLQCPSGIKKVQACCRAFALWSLPKSLTLSLTTLFWPWEPQWQYFSWSRKTASSVHLAHLIPQQEHLPWILSPE